MSFSDEIIYHFEADIYVPSGYDQILGIDLWWYSQIEPDYIGFRTDLKFTPMDYGPIIQLNFSKDGTLIAQKNLGPANYDQLYKLSITYQNDHIRVGINGNETNFFHGLYHDPESFIWSYCSVHGSGGPDVNINYYTDNIVAYTSKPPKFDYVALGSEVRQYDPTRYSFDKSSIWYNGNPYWFMSTFAGTSGDPPIYPVFLDAPIYSDPSNTVPYGLDDIPNYVTNTNFSAAGLYPVSGFHPPGPAWEDKTYTFLSIRMLMAYWIQGKQQKTGPYLQILSER